MVQEIQEIQEIQETSVFLGRCNLLCLLVLLAFGPIRPFSSSTPLSPPSASSSSPLLPTRTGNPCLEMKCCRSQSAFSGVLGVARWPGAGNRPLVRAKDRKTTCRDVETYVNWMQGGEERSRG